MISLSESGNFGLGQNIVSLNSFIKIALSSKLVDVLYEKENLSKLGKSNVTNTVGVDIFRKLIKANKRGYGGDEIVHHSKLDTKKFHDLIQTITNIKEHTRFHNNVYKEFINYLKQIGKYNILLDIYNSEYKDPMTKLNKDSWEFTSDACKLWTNMVLRTAYVIDTVNIDKFIDILYERTQKNINILNDRVVESLYKRV